VYCGPDCKKAGRVAQVREAKRKYLADEDVREGERQRLRDYRARVPDHGSQKLALDASVPIDATRTLMDSGGERDGGNDHASQESPVGLLQPELGAPQPPAMPAPPPVALTASPPPVDLTGPAPPVAPRAVVRPAGTEVRCAFCGRRTLFVRFGPLRRGRTPRWQIRGRDP
jgi:hypothetical protein